MENDSNNLSYSIEIEEPNGKKEDNINDCNNKKKLINEYGFEKNKSLSIKLNFDFLKNKNSKIFSNKAFDEYLNNKRKEKNEKNFIEENKKEDKTSESTKNCFSVNDLNIKCNLKIKDYENIDKMKKIKNNFDENQNDNIISMQSSFNFKKDKSQKNLTKYYTTFNSLSNIDNYANIGHKEIFSKSNKKRKIKAYTQFIQKDNIYNLIDLLNGDKINHLKISKNSASIRKKLINHQVEKDKTKQIKGIPHDKNSKNGHMFVDKMNMFPLYKFHNNKKKALEQMAKRKKLFHYSENNSTKNNSIKKSEEKSQKNKMSNNKKQNRLKLMIDKDFQSNNLGRNIKNANLQQLELDKIDNINKSNNYKFFKINTCVGEKSDIFEKKFNHLKMILKLNKLKKSKKLYNYFQHILNNETSNMLQILNGKNLDTNKMKGEFNIYTCNVGRNPKVKMNDKNYSTSFSKYHSIRKSPISSYSSKNIQNNGIK